MGRDGRGHLCDSSPGRFVLCGRMLTCSDQPKNGRASSYPPLELSLAWRPARPFCLSDWEKIKRANRLFIFCRLSTLYYFPSFARELYSIVLPPGYSFRADTHLSIIYTRRTTTVAVARSCFFTRPYITQPGNAWFAVSFRNLCINYFLFLFCFSYLFIKILCFL